MRKVKDNYTFLTTAPVDKVIRTMSVPTIVSMLVTSAYNIADTFFVGRINTQAVAAVGVAFPIMALIQACAFFFGQGSGTYISRKLGAKETADASKMASTAFYSAFVFGVAIAVLGLIFLEPLSIALGSTPTILPYTKDFLGIILLGAPFITSALCLNNQLRFQGNASYAMWGIMSGAVLNMLFVPLFIFVFKMGIRGAAIGTVAGQVASFVILLLMTHRPGGMTPKLKDWATEGRFYKEIFKGGTPSFARQGLGSVATLLLNLAAGPYGDAAIAGMSIVTRMSAIVFSIIIGVGQGFQPLCGFNYGAGLYDRVRKGFFYCIRVGLEFLVPVCVLGFIFSADLIDLMRHDPEVVAVGKVALRWQIVTYPLSAFITFSNMMLQTSGRTRPATLLASCRNGIFFIPLILILPHFLGLLGVESCQAISDVFSFCVGVPLVARYFRSIKG